MSVMVRLLLFALMSPKGTPGVPPCVRARGQEKRRGDRAAEGRNAISSAGEPRAFLDPTEAPAHGTTENPEGDARTKGAASRMPLCGAKRIGPRDREGF